MAEQWGSVNAFSGNWALRKYGAGTCPVGPSRCHLPVDVVFQSTEPEKGHAWRRGHPELVGAHSAMLAAQGEGFPSPGDVTAATEPVPLSEDGTALRLLFIFMHSNNLGGPPIDILRKIVVKDLVGLAIAAEKYMVQNLIGLCRLAIQARVREVPVEALHYGLKFDDAEIVDLAAPLCIGEEELKLFELGMGMFHDISTAKRLAWFQWRERYLQLAETILAQPAVYINSKGRPHDCGLWVPYRKVILDGLPTTTFALAEVLGKKRPKELIEERWKLQEHRDLVGTCRVCKERAEKWESNLETALISIIGFSRM